MRASACLRSASHAAFQSCSRAASSFIAICASIIDRLELHDGFPTLHALPGVPQCVLVGCAADAEGAQSRLVRLPDPVPGDAFSSRRRAIPPQHVRLDYAIRELAGDRAPASLLLIQDKIHSVLLSGKRQKDGDGSEPCHVSPSARSAKGMRVPKLFRAEGALAPLEQVRPMKRVPYRPRPPAHV